MRDRGKAGNTCRTRPNFARYISLCLFQSGLTGTIVHHQSLQSAPRSLRDFRRRCTGDAALALPYVQGMQRCAGATNANECSVVTSWGVPQAQGAQFEKRRSLSFTTFHIVADDAVKQIRSEVLAVAEAEHCEIRGLQNDGSHNIVVNARGR